MLWNFLHIGLIMGGQMDENKLIKLKEIEYEVMKTCGMCIHSHIPDTTNWGTCRKYTYEHLKHNNKQRQLSINRYGYCKSFLFNSASDIGKFDQFIK